MNNNTLKLRYFVLCTALLSGLCWTNVFGQNVVFNDINFKNALLNNHSIDTNSDGEISKTEAEAYEGAIRVSSKSIKDLTGIEAFIDITGLYCDNNQITSIDVSKNTKLTHFWCNNNQLTSLVVSNNTALSNLNCSNNKLTSLSLSTNSSLKILDCSKNSINSINLPLSLRDIITDIICDSNKLTSLDLGNFTKLKTINCASNPLTVSDTS